MNKPVSLLDRPASIPVIRRLMAKGWIAPEEAGAMEQEVRQALPWRKWLDRGLLSLGAMFLLAGTICFFAYNWNHLPAVSKLLLASGAVLASLLGATWVGFENFAGKVLLLATSALVGVFLAVFGQIYQTGADSYQLFTAWAVLILPWAVLGQFIPLWLFWLAILNLAMALYWPLAVSLFSAKSFLFLFRLETVSLLVLNCVALASWEMAHRRKIEWLDGGWCAPILVLAVVAAGGTATIGEILESVNRSSNGLGLSLALLLYAGGVAGMGFYFSRVRYSLPSLAIVTLGACITATALAVRVLLAGASGDIVSLWFFLGIIVLGIFGAGGWFLREQRLSHLHLEGEKE